MLADLVNANTRSSKQFERQFNEASEPHLEHTSLAQPWTSTVPQPTATVLSLPPQLVTATNPQAGELVVISREAYPRLRCVEFGGAGWAATVKRTSTSTCRVSFDVARTRDGRQYEESLVPRCFIKARPTSTQATPVAGCKRYRQSTSLA